MVLNRSIAILGGDSRQLSLAKRLVKEGIQIRAYGLPQRDLSSSIEYFEDWKEAIKDISAVLLPLPASSDSKHLFLPLFDVSEGPLLKELFQSVGQNVVIAGGKFSPAVKACAKEYGVRLYDYFECEELQTKNALPTAEGAIFILMREIPRTVSGLSVAVTGFGRVAKALIKLLLAMGATVTVVARKHSDIEAAKALGCETVHLTGKEAMKTLATGQSVIFNTVPHWLFGEELLSEMSAETLIIDLASSPGGVDVNAAALHGIRVIWALSLPGKYAPVTAGEIIAESVLSHLREEGVL
ncbi:MAG: NAD(P)-binding domain-containing protein [Clostridia bacterium]|nr:NAD(P)-binding domain-containing protein [Clostridia bacterium]